MLFRAEVGGEVLAELAHPEPSPALVALARAQGVTDAPAAVNQGLFCLTRFDRTSSDKFVFIRVFKRAASALGKSPAAGHGNSPPERRRKPVEDFLLYGSIRVERASLVAGDRGAHEERRAVLQLPATLPGSPATLPGSPATLPGSPAGLRQSPAALRSAARALSTATVPSPETVWNYRRTAEDRLRFAEDRALSQGLTRSSTLPVIHESLSDE